MLAGRPQEGVPSLGVPATMPFILPIPSNSSRPKHIIKHPTSRVGNVGGERSRLAHHEVGPGTDGQRVEVGDGLDVGQGAGDGGLSGRPEEWEDNPNNTRPLAVLEHRGHRGARV